jgi:hypothetical protein
MVLHIILRTLISACRFVWMILLAFIAILFRNQNDSDERAYIELKSNQRRAYTAAITRPSCFPMPAGCLQRSTPSTHIFRVRVAHAHAAPLGHTNVADAVEEADRLLVRPNIALRCRQRKEEVYIRHELFFTEQMGYPIPTEDQCEDSNVPLTVDTNSWSTFDSRTVPLLLAGWKIKHIQWKQQIDGPLLMHFGYSSTPDNSLDSSVSGSTIVWSPALPTIRSDNEIVHLFTLASNESIQLVELHESADMDEVGRCLTGVSFYTDAERICTVGSRGCTETSSVKSAFGVMNAPSGAELIGMQGLSLNGNTRSTGLLQCCFIFARHSMLDASEFNTSLEYPKRHRHRQSSLRHMNRGRKDSHSLNEGPFHVACEPITHPDDAQQQLLTVLKQIEVHTAGGTNTAVQPRVLA